MASEHTKRRHIGPLTALFVEKVEKKQQLDPGFASKALAAKLGINYGLLQRWIRGDAPIPASAIPLICKTFGDCELLDWLEAELGRRVAYLPVPDASHQAVEELKVEDVKAIKRLMEEVAEALGELAVTLKDHRVTAPEFKRTARELDDVTRECERLKQWLHARVQRKAVTSETARRS